MSWFECLQCLDPEPRCSRTKWETRALFCTSVLLLLHHDGLSPHRPLLEPLAQWDSPMQVKLSCWKSGLNTLLVELLPWALLANHSQWDLWLFEGETIVLQIPAGKVIVPPNFKVACAQTLSARLQFVTQASVQEGFRPPGPHRLNDVTWLFSLSLKCPSTATGDCRRRSHRLSITLHDKQSQLHL